jgi:signal transduction histidine kinase
VPTPAHIIAELTSQLLAAERGRAERVLNRVRAWVLLLMAAAALVYSTMLPEALTEVNAAVLLPLLVWTLAQHRWLGRPGAVPPGWLPPVNALIDITAVTMLLAGYGTVGNADIAVKSPIFLAYLAILASRPFTGSERNALVAAVSAWAQYAALVAGLALSGRLVLHASPLDALVDGGTSLFDEGAKLLLLAVTGGIAVYATRWTEATLRRALTMQVKHDAEERDLAVRLQEADKLAAVGALAATVAHEVSTPLTAIRMYAELLSHTPLSEGQRDDVIAIAGEADRTARVLRDVLRVARPDLEDGDDISLTDTAARALEMLRPMLRDQQVTVERELGDVPALRGHPGRLEQVVVNILLNAVQAMEGRAAPRTLRVRSGADAERVWLEVDDSGPGFPPGVAARVFERFFSTKPAGKGTGLGLWIAREVVTEHGGSIVAQNAPDGGARVRIALPLHGRATAHAGGPSLRLSA